MRNSLKLRCLYGIRRPKVQLTTKQTKQRQTNGSKLWLCFWNSVVWSCFCYLIDDCLAYRAKMMWKAFFNFIVPWQVLQGHFWSLLRCFTKMYLIRNMTGACKFVMLHLAVIWLSVCWKQQGSCSETTGTAAALTSNPVSSCQQLQVPPSPVAKPDDEDLKERADDTQVSGWGHFLGGIYPFIKIMQIQVIINIVSTCLMI